MALFLDPDPSATSDELVIFFLTTDLVLIASVFARTFFSFPTGDFLNFEESLAGGGVPDPDLVDTIIYPREKLNQKPRKLQRNCKNMGLYRKCDKKSERSWGDKEKYNNRSFNKPTKKNLWKSVKSVEKRLTAAKLWLAKWNGDWKIVGWVDREAKQE